MGKGCGVTDRAGGIFLQSATPEYLKGPDPGGRPIIRLMGEMPLAGKSSYDLFNRGTNQKKLPKFRVTPARLTATRIDGEPARGLSAPGGWGGETLVAGLDISRGPGGAKNCRVRCAGPNDTVQKIPRGLRRPRAGRQSGQGKQKSCVEINRGGTCFPRGDPATFKRAANSASRHFIGAPPGGGGGVGRTILSPGPLEGRTLVEPPQVLRAGGLRGRIISRGQKRKLVFVGKNKGRAGAQGEKKKRENLESKKWGARGPRRSGQGGAAGGGSWRFVGGGWLGEKEFGIPSEGKGRLVMLVPKKAHTWEGGFGGARSNLFLHLRKLAKGSNSITHSGGFDFADGKNF